MNVQIPIAGVTLSDDQTYNGQLPVWATRPLMLRLLPDLYKPVNIIVREGGSLIKRITLPYQEIINFDLSFAAPLLRRADRNNSEGGGTAFPQQMIEIWGANTMARILIPVFHCDLTYWDTLGADSALPQPPKPRIPNQTLDIYFPYRINPLDAFQVEVEPVTGAPSSAIFPTTYVLGNTIDITYIKKLTIKNVWGNGLDQVINYEDRLMSEAIYDTGLQCALRARWNMRNGQWFWAAFKDYFWSNKFTPIRGRGGVTEQAELTINLEYGEEWYNVYQELLVSSNVMFDLNLPGINQYQNKRFRAEVIGDTGARWSNSTKTYRQQVRFRTTELQDNYIFPQQPDQPPTPSIAFSAQKNPWTIGAAYSEELVNSIYSNAAWEVQSEPSWLTVTNGTTLLTPDFFEQGSVNGTAGLTWEQAKKPSANVIRLIKPFTHINNEIYSIISRAPGYAVTFIYLNSDGRITGVEGGGDLIGRINSARSPQISLVFTKSDGGNIAPADVTAINAYWGKRYHQFPADTSNLTATIATNTGEARTGSIVLKSKAGSATYTIPITQQKASISFSVKDTPVNNFYQDGFRITTVTANTDWEIVPGDIPSWLTINPVTGNAGTRDIFANIQANTGAKRTAYITFRSKVNTSVTKILFVYQAAATGNISVDTPTLNVDYLTHPVTVDVTSFGNWSVPKRDPWITPSVLEGWGGTTTVTLTIADNTSNDGRTGTIRFYDHIAREFATVTVNQGGLPQSILLSPLKITGDAAGRNVTEEVIVISQHSWVMGSAPDWVATSPAAGAEGQTIITVTYDTPNNTGVKRSGYLRLENTTTHEIAICIIEQEG